MRFVWLCFLLILVAVAIAAVNVVQEKEARRAPADPSHGARLEGGTVLLGESNEVLIVRNWRLTNPNRDRELYNFTINCRLMGAGGRELGSLKRTIYERLGPAQSMVLDEVNFGVISPQTETANCKVTRAERTPAAAPQQGALDVSADRHGTGAGRGPIDR